MKENVYQIKRSQA